MSIEQAINSLSSLSASEQLQVVSAIWDSLPEDVSDLLPNSEKAILDERLAKYRANPQDLITEEELREELRKRKQK